MRRAHCNSDSWHKELAVQQSALSLSHVFGSGFGDSYSSVVPCCSSGVFAMSQRDSEIANFCQAMACDTEVARKFLLAADWDLSLAAQRFIDSAGALDTSTSSRCRRCGDWWLPQEGCLCGKAFQVRCPYDDCGRVYEVRGRDLRCRVARCGGNVYLGRFYQFPAHGRRQDIQDWLQVAEWGGQEWSGWPGSTEGCGRPFRFGDGLREFAPNTGAFATWDDREAPQGPTSVDPDGDYSRVTLAVDAVLPNG